MALSPLYSINEADDALSVILTDVTGAYNASTNAGGYGTPNIEWADVSYVKLGLTTPDAVVMDDITIIASAFDSSRQTTVLATDFGLSEEYEDGVYTLVYKVYNAADVLQGTYTAKFLLYAQTYSLLRQAVLKMAFGESTACGCKGADYARKITDIRVLLYATRIAVIEEAFDSANKAIKKIKRKCENICKDC